MDRMTELQNTAQSSQNYVLRHFSSLQKKKKDSQVTSRVVTLKWQIILEIWNHLGIANHIGSAKLAEIISIGLPGAIGLYPIT